MVLSYNKNTESHFKLKLSTLCMLLPMSWCELLPLNVNAALSATTMNTIQGSAPYLTFDDGVTKATDTGALLSITLSDGTTYTQNNNPSSASKPIILPVSGQSINDVNFYIPKDKVTIALNDLIGEPNHYWVDDDGDGQGDKGINATGELSITITDVNNQAVGRQEALSGCNSPYKVVVSATKGSLTTQYGDPRVTDFNALSATYYISPKIDVPYVCFVKPNLEFSYGSQPEWDAKNGFKMQSLSNPKKNFPRTGFSGAFFDIMMAGTVAGDVITATGKEIKQGGVTATLTEQSDNVVRVTLTGPNNASGGGVFTPSIFTIKSSSTNDIYNFVLSKWFVAKLGKAGGYSAAQAYCNALSGGYRIPSVSEYTNANGNSWTGGLSGQGNTYVRVIGNGKQELVVAGDDGVGGLFAEWARVGNSYYKDGDMETAYYWGVESHNYLSHYVISAYDGAVTSYNSSNQNHRVACVSP